MSNQNIKEKLKKAFELYEQNENLPQLQQSVEGNISALEGLTMPLQRDLRELTNELERIRFLISNEQQKQKVKDVIIKLIEILRPI